MLPEDVLVPRIPSTEDPNRLVPDPEVMGPLSTGYADSGDALPWWRMFSARVPWRQWAGPLWMWTPLVLLMSLGVICLSLVVHPQWSKREHLRYPIADVAATLMRDDPAERDSFLRNRLFWLGFGTILAIRVINGIHAWYPEFIEVPMTMNLGSISRACPYLTTWSNGWLMFFVTWYPTAIALAFFLSSDVSFSLGVSQLVPALVLPMLILRGVDLGGTYLEGGPSAWATFGAYLGTGLLLLYTGRRYYGQTLRRALTFRRSEGVEGYAVWACRGWLLCMAGMFLIFVFRLDLEWPLAALVVLLIYLMFTVLSRMIAESGLFFLQTSWLPLGVLLGLLGASSLGPEAILVIGVISCILVIDPRECLMPFMVTGLKICERTDVQPAKVGLAGVIVFVLAIAVALPVVLWSHYQHGLPIDRNPWVGTNLPCFSFDAGARAVSELSNNDQLEVSMNRSTLGRLSGLWEHHPRKSQFLISVAVGLVLVMLVSLLRLRYTWWPIHPILFLVWSTWAMGCFAGSFLLGWALRTVIERLGGTSAYRKGRIFMIGCIAGDLLGGLIFLVHGGAYSWLTGMTPEKYSIFP